MGGGNTYLLTKLENLDSTLPVCSVSCSPLSSCSFVCLSLQPQASFLALASYLPTFSSFMYCTPCAFVTTMQALCVALYLFSSFIYGFSVQLGCLWNRGSIFPACLQSPVSNECSLMPECTRILPVVQFIILLSSCISGVYLLFFLRGAKTFIHKPYQSF